jgi:hypothetical protein
MSTNGSSIAADAVHTEAEVDQLLQQQESADVASARGGWFTRLVAWYLRQRYSRRGAAAESAKRDDRTEGERAQSVIRWACIKSALTGAASGGLTTTATVITAETEGLAALVAVPAAAFAIGGEMIFRAVAHLDMACDLADIFGIPINPDDPADFWRIYALAFHAKEHDSEEDPGKGLLSKVVEVETHDVGESIGHRLVGESVLRNVVPFVGIATSSIGNWKLTRRVGDTIRRYYRYQRALRDAFAQDEKHCAEVMDLLLEGFWFIFTADGQLSPEEAAALAGMLKKLDPVERARVVARFTDDEYEWAERIREIPEHIRDHFLHALYVAAAVDKEVTLPERKILRRAARKLGREFDAAEVDRMIQQFEAFGVLKQEAE